MQVNNNRLSVIFNVFEVFFSSLWCNKRDGFYTRTTFDFYPEEKRGVGSGNLKTLGELTGIVRDVEFFKN